MPARVAETCVGVKGNLLCKCRVRAWVGKSLRCGKTGVSLPAYGINPERDTVDSFTRPFGDIHDQIPWREDEVHGFVDHDGSTAIRSEEL
jgi:hypothetical protein